MTSFRSLRGLLPVLLILCSSLGVHCGQAGNMSGEPLNPVIVIFADGLQVSASGKSFQVTAAEGASGVPAGPELAAALTALNERIAREDVWEIATVFPDSAQAGEHAAEIARIWAVTLSASTPKPALEALATDLGRNPLVRESYVQPTPEDAGSTEPGPPGP